MIAVAGNDRPGVDGGTGVSCAEVAGSGVCVRKNRVYRVGAINRGARLGVAVERQVRGVSSGEGGLLWSEGRDPDLVGSSCW